MSAPVPGSPEWLRLVSSSKVAAILGVSPWQSPFSLWMEMSGRIEPADRSSDATRRGELLEHAVIRWWRSRHDEFSHDYEQYVARGLWPWAIATIDLVAYDGCGVPTVVEAKTTASWDEWGEEGTDAIPSHYYAQVLWQMACMGRRRPQRAYVPVLGPFLDFREYVVERDDDLIADLVTRCRTFYDSLSSDTPPPLDDHVATLATLRRAHPDITRGQVATIPTEAAAEFVAADLALRAAEARATAARSVVLAAAERAQYIDTPEGVRVARRQGGTRGSVSLVRVAKTPPTVGVAA